MLAASAGFGVAKPQPDVAGIDFHIVGMREVEDDFPLAKVQVKSWSDPKGDDLSLHYNKLNQKQFNVLAGKRHVPAFLFVILVPPDARQYARNDHRELHLSHAGYWVSLANKPKFRDPTANSAVMVHIPRENLLTVDSLTALCHGSVTSPLARSS